MTSQHVRSSSSMLPDPLSRPIGFEELRAARSIDEATDAVIKSLQSRRQAVEASSVRLASWAPQYLQQMHITVALTASDLRVLPGLTFDKYIDAVELEKMVAELADMIRDRGGRAHAKEGEGEANAVFEEVVRRLFVFSLGYTSNGTHLVATKSRIALSMLCAPSAAGGIGHMLHTGSSPWDMTQGGDGRSVHVSLSDLSCMVRVFAAVSTSADPSGVDKWMVDAVLQSFHYIITEPTVNENASCKQAVSSLYELLIRHDSAFLGRAIEESLALETASSPMDPSFLHKLQKEARVDKSSLLVELLITYFMRGGVESLNKILNSSGNKARTAIVEQSSQILLRCVSFAAICQVALRLSKLTFLSNADSVFANWCLHIFCNCVAGDSMYEICDFTVKNTIHLSRTGQRHDGNNASEEIEFICRSVISAIEYFGAENLREVCLSLKPIRSYNSSAVDELVSIVSQSQSSQSFLASNVQSSMPELNADRIRHWAATIVKTQSLPPAVIQFCQFQGPTGYKSVIARMNALTESDDSLAADCETIIRMMVSSKPPVCSKSEYEIFMEQRSRKKIIHGLILFCKKSAGSLSQFILESSCANLYRVLDSLIMVLSAKPLSVGEDQQKSILLADVVNGFHACFSIPAEVSNAYVSDWNALQLRIATVIVSTLIAYTTEAISEVFTSSRQLDKPWLSRMESILQSLFASPIVLCAFAASFFKCIDGSGQRAAIVWHSVLSSACGAAVPEDCNIAACSVLLALMSIEMLQKFGYEFVRCDESNASSSSSKCTRILVLVSAIDFILAKEGVEIIENGPVAKKMRPESDANVITDRKVSQKLKLLSALLTFSRDFWMENGTPPGFYFNFQRDIERINEAKWGSEARFDQFILENIIEWIKLSRVPARAGMSHSRYRIFGRDAGLAFAGPSRDAWSEVARSIVRSLSDSLQRSTDVSGDASISERIVKCQCAIVLGDLVSTFPPHTVLYALNSFLRVYLSILLSASHNETWKGVMLHLVKYTVTNDFAIGLGVARGLGESNELLRYLFFSRHVLSLDENPSAPLNSVFLEALPHQAAFLIDCGSIARICKRIEKEVKDLIKLPFDHEDDNVNRILSWTNRVRSADALNDLSIGTLDEIELASMVPLFAEDISKLLLAHQFRSDFKIGFIFNDSRTELNQQIRLLFAQARMYGSLLGREILCNWSFEAGEIKLILNAFEGLLSSWKSHLDAIPTRFRTPFTPGAKSPILGFGTNLGIAACIGGLVALSIYPRCQEVPNSMQYSKNVSVVFTFLRGLLSESLGGFDVTNLVDCIVDYHAILPDIVLESAVLCALRLESLAASASSGGETPEPEYKEEDIKSLIAMRVSALATV